MADSDDTQFPLSPMESTDHTIGGNVLSIDDLYEALDAVLDAADKWYNFGLALNLRETTLMHIEADHGSSDCKTCLRETLSHWLRNSQSTTWQDVIQALCSRSVDQRKIAEDIGRLSCIDSYHVLCKPQCRTVSPLPSIGLKSMLFVSCMQLNPEVSFYQLQPFQSH